jgi:hypothetical protein
MASGALDEIAATGHLRMWLTKHVAISWLTAMTPSSELVTPHGTLTDLHVESRRNQAENLISSNSV